MIFYDALAVLLLALSVAIIIVCLLVGFVLGTILGPFILLHGIFTAKEDPAEVAARVRRSRINIPDCFGSNPSPQSQAENDCANCAHRNSCFSIRHR